MDSLVITLFTGGSKTVISIIISKQFFDTIAYIYIYIYYKLSN